MKKVVLAFSGGLDTSYCAVYLARELNLEVHAVIVQTGGFSEEELCAIEDRALTLGVASFKVLDVTQQYYESCIKYLIFGNVLKNNTYPLSVSAERMIQAISVAEYARMLDVEYVAHGSTGAGNDQVRFDIAFQSMIPEIKILTPIRDNNLSRNDEISFLQRSDIVVNLSKAPYSINKGLWGTSVGGKETLSSREYLPEIAWPTSVKESESQDIILHFDKGQLCGLNDNKDTEPVQIIQELQELAQPYGIGRDIHVGDTIIGIKGRVGFEAAAPMIIIKAHHLLEKHTLTKWQLQIKEQLSSWYGNWLHEGMMQDPVMRDIESFLESSQGKVTGKVFVTLYPYRFVITGIESDNDLMSGKFGFYGEANNTWTGEDVRGFSRIFGNQLSIYNSVNKETVATI